MIFLVFWRNYIGIPFLPATTARQSFLMRDVIPRRSFKRMGCVVYLARHRRGQTARSKTGVLNVMGPHGPSCEGFCHRDASVCAKAPIQNARGASRVDDVAAQLVAPLQ